MPEYPLHGSKWFDVREFVDEKTWQMLGPKSAWLVDPRIVRVADLLREKSGVRVVVNNWHYAKSGEYIYHSSGFRARWDDTGAVLSQHRRGFAADLKVDGLTPRQAMLLVQANEADFKAVGLTTMEDVASTPTWLHCDCRPILEGSYPSTGFLIVQPN